ncbi:uncharacterized protein I303_107937 [Kwoniella dejecticola CBS 10117]|uniref:Protein DGCR14 n=1 Tax=Kwoniella dejecticola CBS 10117 TaxID=1296121 RepID=A0A1A5ZW28_9TREE|nr:uncharacterized protein I303_07930 [Kwoniella dejecticola CBS 10117]OBR82016.1 hypothetical protein I303_07930 [Kwoniella dejecticola CBS 10117]
MSGEPSNTLIPRTGPAPKLITGPKAGQRSLYHQHVLDEDTYTDALSHIITRDFFPNLPHLHATNDYLTALTESDPELLSSSIRKLAHLAQEKENGRATPVGGRRSLDDIDAERVRRNTEYAMAGTPYISLPGGGGRPTRTPIGARGWETPISTRSSRKRYEDYDELDGTAAQSEAGSSQSRPIKKPRQKMIRDDLSLDAFQRNYTSEDNASFVQIVDEENRKRREERWGWAFEAEKKANQRRIEGEEKRKMILDAALSGNWRVDGEGRRLIGGLAEGGRDRNEGEAWKDIKLIQGSKQPDDRDHNTKAEIEGSEGQAEEPGTGALVPHASGSASSALIKAGDNSSNVVQSKLAEIPLPPKHPLTEALTSAGLPGTALISTEDGQIVPHREGASGADDGRGRGDDEKALRQRIERDVLGEENNSISLAGSGADQWGYKARNNLMFPADSDSDPYPKLRPKADAQTQTQAQSQAIANPPAISHANTRLPDEEEVRPSRGEGSAGSRRGSSPARSWVDAAVKGTPYHREPSMPVINSYPLLPNDPSPSPQDLPSLLTWGTLLSTPRALDGEDGSNDPLTSSSYSSSKSFRLPETKRRDEIGRKLADKASKSISERARSFTPQSNYLHRSSTNNLSSTLRAAADKSQRSVRGSKTPGFGQMLPPPPGSTPRRQAESLTPAGRKLLERSVGRSPMTSSGGVRPMSTGGKNRGPVMETRSGWGGGNGSQAEKRMTWTPSPRK